MSINGGTLHGRTMNQGVGHGYRDRVWRNLLGSRALGAIIENGHVKYRDNGPSKQQQILNLINQFRSDSDDYNYNEPEYYERVDDQYITITVKFDDLTYRFDGVIPGAEDKEKFMVLSMNTIDNVEFNITNLTVEINDHL